MSTLLGFDYGTRRIGVAIGQTVTGTAQPLITLHSRDGKPDWAGITALVNEWRPTALVVGLPLDLDGREVDWSPRLHRFVRQLAGRFRLEVHLIDERFTSIEAQHRLDTRPRRRTHPDMVDAVAATLILETWLSEQEAA
ncbi:MAG: Holliday junction resolvase RuvX [Sphingobacteriia bacterium]|nr:Holliday junction resolvase RuvX [Sphingobacteriia bacterium]NCC38362.1 Holliday junction resolvase RuvX [Gammaproteobacteria bacterium]